MASRSLTEVFILMRNNAIRNRHIYSDQDANEHMSLVQLCDAEEGMGGTSCMPPQWTDHLEEAQMTLTKLRSNIAELDVLHSKHLHRSTFEENTEEEMLIASRTQEISSMFNSVHKAMQFVKSHMLDGTPRERLLTANVVRALATALQDVSIQYRSTQNNYLKQLRSREERSKKYFEDPALDNDYDLISPQNDQFDEFFVSSSKQMTQQQLLYLEEENIQMVEQREQEINSIVRSIVELNDIFKDLSRMVVDQGTVLDRIDYNVEQTHTQVYEGFKQLQKADAYQRKNRKMWLIIGLAATGIILFFLLIIIKT